MKKKDKQIKRLKTRLSRSGILHPEQPRQIGVSPERFEELRQENEKMKKELDHQRALIHSLKEKIKELNLQKESKHQTNI